MTSEPPAASEVWDEETAASYDADSADMFAAEVVDPTVDLLERLADGGPALELAIGTGRIALPLAARGVPVTGIELSPAMVAQLRRKPGAELVAVEIGDMTSTMVQGAGTFALVYLVWNSLSNLRTQRDQVACFANAARHLRPGGRFVVELWVPPIHRLGDTREPLVMSDDAAHVIVDTYDTAAQTCTSDHYIAAGHDTYRHSAGHFRYVWPAECDLMAQLAGLELESRWSGWGGEPFTATSQNHVSVWRRP